MYYGSNAIQFQGISSTKSKHLSNLENTAFKFKCFQRFPAPIRTLKMSMQFFSPYLQT